MKLNKYKLGKLIEWSDERNDNLEYGLSNVKGISIKKEFIETKADMNGVSLKPYKLVKNDYFAYVPITSRNGNKITLAHNTTNDVYIVSSSYIVFRVIKPKIIDTDYLFMFFNRFEFDRYSRFNSWGSAREAFSWEEMCDIDLELPDIEIQKKYVAIYKAMLENQKSYERGLEDFKLACDIYIEEKIDNYEAIGKFISVNEKRNTEGRLEEKEIKGFDVNGDFIKPARVFSGDIEKFRIISNGDFVYNPRIPTVTYPVALNNSEKDILVSPAYTTFYITDKNKLNEEYLIMVLQRESFSRKILFNTWGSSTPFLRHEDLCDIKIPVPNIHIQRALAELYKTYTNRRLLNERLKEQIKNICPILIKGSLEEAKSN